MSLQVPEYYPPPRVEAWLTLPPGAVVARDDPDYVEPYREEPRYPQVHSDIARRFRATFGNQAALDWDLEPNRMWLLNKTLKEVYCSERLQEQFYREIPWAA